MRVSLPLPFYVAIPVAVAMLLIAAEAGVVWALGFIGLVTVIAHVRQWQTTHESPAQRLADGAHLGGVASGVALLLAFRPSGIWGPILFFGPAVVATPLAAAYTGFQRRPGRLTSHAEAVFHEEPGAAEGGAR